MDATYAARSEIGQRANNEDSYIEDPQAGLWVVADGMGGSAAGEVASRIVTETVSRKYREGESLTKSIQAAHQRIRASHAQGIGTPDMGSTVVAAVLNRGALQVAWVGDSRAYLWNGTLTRLTRDHSLVQQKIDQGFITEAEGRASGERNVITQCLGGRQSTPVQVEMVERRLSRGDRVLLCSDGLLDRASDFDIADIFKKHAASSDEDVVTALLAAAGGKDARDNATVIVVTQRTDYESRKQRLSFYIGIGLGLLIIALMFFFGERVERDSRD